ncbi:class I adenylate-forming enzyme family protein [Gordonia sp. NPDC127522]|uniref:class I adenylate-forming enzyme family protein n=1 Tax=Gordonia sp. NPDC127522 TaxID=3345390 RepID=UPI0036368C12
MHPTTIARVLESTLRTNPEAPAVEAKSGVWSYRELDREATRAAGALWSMGVRPGDRVAACLPNDLDIVAAFHGAQRVGAIWAGIGEALSAEEQGGLHELCSPTVLIAGSHCGIDAPSRVDVEQWTTLLKEADAPPQIEIDPDAPAGIAFTSGTSGLPKAVVHSQRNLLLPGAALVADRRWGTALRKGDSFPMTILNLMVLSTLLCAQAGGCAVVMDRRDVDGVVDWIGAGRVNVWNGAPAQLYDLARRSSADLGSLTEVWSGGGDTSDSLRRDFARAHGIVPRATYGLTEAPTVVAIDPPGGEWRPGASGRVMPQYDVAAYDDEGRRLAPGETGELRLSGAASGSWAGQWTPLLGYWRDGTVHDDSRGGTVSTGDIGQVDENGWLSVLDRKKLVIIRGGANVYPMEVERVIASHPMVERVAVCSIADDRLGQRVAAVVQTSIEDIDFDAIAAACGRSLASYKVPEVWKRVDQLPVNAMGKVERTRLATILGTTEHRPSGAR